MRAEQTVMPGLGLSLEEKTWKAVETIKEYERFALELSPDGYHLAFSGGKDSVVIKALADMAGVKYKAVYAVTTIDPPELIQFIRKHHADVEWKRHRKEALLTRVALCHGLPNRRFRWCCEEYKEDGGDGLWKILGIRAAESPNRKERWSVVSHWHSRKGGMALNPILYWTDEDVWQFIRTNETPYCKLYDEGFKRIGCIGCPMAAGQRRAQFARWPKYEAAWRKAAVTYWADRHETKDSAKPNFCARFDDGNAFFEWWLDDNGGSKGAKEDACQMGMF